MGRCSLQYMPQPSGGDMRAFPVNTFNLGFRGGGHGGVIFAAIWMSEYCQEHSPVAPRWL